MQDKITIADAPDCLNTNDKAMWVLGYEAAIEARGQCLHQIQEPSAAEQGAWHAGLDEGRAQAAPAAVAVPDVEIALLMNRSACQKYPNDINLRIAHNEGWKAARAALAATPAAACGSESVLIDGVAYDVPAAVAGELLSLHLDLIAAAPTYIEVRECSDCGHIGINDADGSKAACSKCDWQGDSPVEDKCPDCNTVGTMTAACSKCGARASLLAETTLHAEPIAPTAAAPVMMPEPVAYRLRNTAFRSEVYEYFRTKYLAECRQKQFNASVDDGGLHELTPIYTEPQVRALLATGGQAQAVPDGWREQFAVDVYADLAAADNQDVPLEEYPGRILKVFDAIVGPRHPVVIKWRNDAIQSCIAIAYKYCRDPESHKYLEQDLEAMLTTEPAPQAQADARDAERYRWLRKSPNPACDIRLATHFGGGRGQDFEALIDAAIAAAKGE